MLTQLSLRLRVFLFFVLMAVGGAAVEAGALWFGWSRAEEGLPAGPFVTAFVLFAFVNTGLLLGIWLLFDENLAKPIEKLASSLRLRAHSDVDAAFDLDAARYLGDLAPAANAVSETMGKGVLDSAEGVARETERLRSETERLTAMLTEIPVAILLLNPAFEIVVYDGQAADLLGKIAPPRLKAPLSDYFAEDRLAAACDRAEALGEEVPVTLAAADRSYTFDAKLKPLGDNGYMLTIESEENALSPSEARPLVYDFDLLESTASTDIRATPLQDLCFVAFDTETTGLSPQTDDVVQIGAVRMLGARIVEGEVFDSFVNPGRPIPPGSTVIHGVSDAHVADAPDFVTAGRTFHHFCRNAVLVAHNAPFDIGFLKRFETDMDVAWDHPVLDTVLLSAIVFGTTEEHSLDALCERLGIAIPEERRHTALGDAKVTAGALQRLIPILEGKGLNTFGDVIGETRKHGRLLQDLNAAQGH